MKESFVIILSLILLSSCFKGKVEDPDPASNAIESSQITDQDSADSSSKDAAAAPEIDKSRLKAGEWSMVALLQPYSGIGLQFRMNDEYHGFVCMLKYRRDYVYMSNEAVMQDYENIDIKLLDEGMEIKSVVTEYQTKDDLLAKVNGVTTNVTFFVDRDMLVAAILSKEGGDADIPSVFHVFVDKEGDRYISRKVMRYGDYP